MEYRNPFLSIVPRKGEKIINISEVRIKELAKDLPHGKKILIISGDYGSGKSLIEETICKSLNENVKIEKWMLNVDLVNELRSIPIEKALTEKVVVFIDKFELSDVMHDKELMKILNLIVESSKAGVGFVISTTPRPLARLFDLNYEFKNLSKIYNLKPMLYPDIVKLIISRLNEVRTKKSENLDPFTNEEIRNIWKKSNGNPRMILLILANLYDIKKQKG